MTISVRYRGFGIEEGPGTAGTRVISKDYPYDEGLSGAVTKQIENPNLEEE